MSFFVTNPTYFRAMPGTYDRPPSPVKINPENREKDIEDRMKLEHLRINAVGLLRETKRKKYNVTVISDSILRKDLSMQDLLAYIKELELLLTTNTIKADTPQDKFNAEKFLKQAKKLKITGLPDKPPTENLEAFNENLCDLIGAENRRQREEAEECLRQLRSEEKNK